MIELKGLKVWAYMLDVNEKFFSFKIEKSLLKSFIF